MRNEKGQFVLVSGVNAYKHVQYNGVVMGEHTRKICVLLGIDRIPKGLVVHHLDKNKSNNDIHNLSLMTMTAHNRLHSHPAWNKGLDRDDDRVEA